MFSGNAGKKVSGKPKGYLSDSGLICALQMLSSPRALAGHPLFGAVFEAAAVQEIRKQNNALAASAKLHHWRAHSGAELDLLLERDGKFFPIEIKGKSHPDKNDARGIDLFRKNHGNLRIERGLILSLSESAYQVTEQDWVIPWDLGF